MDSKRKRNDSNKGNEPIPEKKPREGQSAKEYSPSVGKTYRALVTVSSIRSSAT